MTTAAEQAFARVTEADALRSLVRETVDGMDDVIEQQGTDELHRRLACIAEEVDQFADRLYGTFASVLAAVDAAELRVLDGEELVA